MLGPLLLSTAAAVLHAPTGPPVASAETYPRLGLYGAMTGDGYPLWAPDSTYQDTTLDAITRYHEVIIDASPISEYRPAALGVLRARNPGTKYFAYVTGHAMWNVMSNDSLVHYPTRYFRMIRDLGGWLYNTSGGVFQTSIVNLAKRSNGRYIVAESIADLFRDAVMSSSAGWDGIFLDIYCKSILWMESPTEHIDYTRAGYLTLSAFDAAWAAAMDTLGNRLRRHLGPSVEMIGNCTPSENYASFNGWMREDFPRQGGGDWYTNMFREFDGYFFAEAGYRTPRSNYMFSAMSGTNPYTATNTRKVRFGMGSAALGSGYAVFGPSARAPGPYPYWMYWYDEYAVDRSTGRSSSSLQYTGWLGQPLGPYSQMIWIAAGPDYVSNPGFETSVTTGWSWNHTVPATLSQDATTAAVGSASAKIHVGAASTIHWSVAYSPLDQVYLTAGLSYSATFWAKASVPRKIKVAAGANAAHRVAITTEWTRYQVALRPFPSGTATPQFFLAESAGDVWLDDVHFQEGSSTLYRRDFQNGIVLVNPASTSMTAPLERTYRKILGVRDPAINDGSSTNQVTVGPSDALFLIGDDTIPPSGVTDLQPGPAWTPRTTRAKPAAEGGRRP